MRRGIHLRQLRNRDLTVLGVEEGRVSEPESQPGRICLREADPALGRLVGEARKELEGLLAILDAALAATEPGTPRRDAGGG